MFVLDIGVTVLLPMYCSVTKLLEYGVPPDTCDICEYGFSVNEDEHELQQYSHANGIPKESNTVEDKLLDYARIEHARKMQVLEEERVSY
jgi:hypothetical protein